MIKVFDYVINLEDDGTGLYFNSLVPEPAIMTDFQFFNKENKEFENFAEQDEEKRIVTGPVLIPDLKMLRRFKDGSGYYYCKFSKESILNMGKKMAKEEKFNKVSYNHWQKLSDNIDNTKELEGVYLIEQFFINERNKSELYNDLPEGTLMATYWIENDNVWEAVKNGEVKGFSVEVKVSMEEEENIKTELKKAILSVINDETLSKEDKILRLEHLLPTP